MSDGILDRREGESARDWVLRLHVDPWFEDAIPAELADFTGLPINFVKRSVLSWARSSNVKRIHAHAKAVAEAIDWPGTPEGLVHIALERYAQRVGAREAGPRVTLDQEIEQFLAENMTQSEATGL